jgi:peptidyl-tRNA hydrolase, PTH1 family
MRASSPKSYDTRLILGLCNPGKEYRDTYHNVGGLFVDYLASVSDVDLKKTRYFEYAKSGKLILVKSLVYMNESGSVAAAAIKYFKVSIGQLSVAHDDSDLTLGSFKITTGQNAAGHHGIESVIAALGTKDFSRLRIGVRPPQEKKRRKAGEFVLNRINRNDSKILDKTFDKICVGLGAKPD